MQHNQQNHTLLHYTGTIAITWNPHRARQLGYTPTFASHHQTDYIKLGNHTALRLHITRDNNTTTAKLTHIPINQVPHPTTPHPPATWIQLTPHNAHHAPQPINLEDLITTT